ncbi:cytochrome c family protein [Egicoccus sp. AB-alg6-2]|uniref:c-type cytochrome n=1 Tax=Egicoccus sp. AB-alg6-2 TaxID=3242692 RepID=UPI00359E1B03
MSARTRPSASSRAPGWLPVVVAVVAALAISACDGGRGERTTGPGAAAGVEFGDADNGREAFVAYGCGACHQHAAVRGASGRVGPKLDDLAEQRIIAGVLPNTPEMLAAWIQDPQAHAADTGMPDVGVTDEDAADIAAFLLEHG